MRANSHAASCVGVTVKTLAINVALKLPSQDKLDCRVFETLEWSSMETLEVLTTIDFHWVQFFSFVKLKNGYVDNKMSPEPGDAGEISILSELRWVCFTACL